MSKATSVYICVPADDLSPVLGEATLELVAVPEAAADPELASEAMGSADDKGSSSEEEAAATPGGGVDREAAWIPVPAGVPEVGWRRRSNTCANTLNVRGATLRGHGSTDTGEIPS